MRLLLAILLYQFTHPFPMAWLRITRLMVTQMIIVETVETFL